jgi:hypothetical protein
MQMILTLKTKVLLFEELVHIVEQHTLKKVDFGCQIMHFELNQMKNLI